MVGVAALSKGLGITDISKIKQILLDSAEDINTTGWDNKTGYGLVRADKAVEMALARQNQESGIMVRTINH